MKSRSQKLMQLLKDKGFNVNYVWYVPTLSFIDILISLIGKTENGWMASINEIDSDNNVIRVDYHLGSCFDEAKENIENKKIKKL